MVVVFRAIAGPLRGRVLEEGGVGAALLGTVAELMIRLGPQHEPEEVGRRAREDGVGLGECGGGVAAGELQQPDVVAGIVVERRQLLVSPDGHGEEEAHAILLVGLSEDHDPVEEPAGALLGRHLTDIRRRQRTAERRLDLVCGSPPRARPQYQRGQKGADRRSGDPPGQADPPGGGRQLGLEIGAALVAELGGGGDGATTRSATHRPGR